MKRCFLLLPVLFMPSVITVAQNRPSSLKAGKTALTKSVTGTYKNVINTFQVILLTDERVLLDFSSYWPNVRRSQMRSYGVNTYNMGSFRETVPLKGIVAVVSLKYSENPCTIRIRFLNNRIKVTQEGGPNDCGFGFNVLADGGVCEDKQPHSKAGLNG